MIEEVRRRFMPAEPQIPESAFVAAGASVVGDVRLGAESSVWYNCVLRGDLHYISVGECTNIQDGTVVHVEHDRPCVIGARVTVGHGAILHACTVEEECLIGMGAIILSGAVIGRGSVVAAGALVRENAVVEPFSLMVGVPARRVRKLDELAGEASVERAERYAEMARMHRRKGGGEG